MSLKNLAVKAGATVSITGGTTEPLTSRGNSLTQNTLVFTEDVFTAQRSLDFGIKLPRPSNASPSGHTQGRRTITARFPMTLSSGDVTVNTIRFELASDIQTSDEEIEGMLNGFIQVLSDSNTESFLTKYTID